MNKEECYFKYGITSEMKKGRDCVGTISSCPPNTDTRLVEQCRGYSLTVEDAVTGKVNIFLISNRKCNAEEEFLLVFYDRCTRTRRVEFATERRT